MVIKLEKQQFLKKRMKTLGIEEKDLLEKFILASGKGGQKVQKTSSAIYLKHIPSGIEVKCQKSRLQSDNRFFARQKLCDIFEERFMQIKSKKQKQIEKIQKQKKRRKRKSKAKIEEKKLSQGDI